MFSLERGLFAAPALLAGFEHAARTPYELRGLPLLAAPSDTEWEFADSAGADISIAVAAPRLRSSNAGIRLASGARRPWRRSDHRDLIASPQFKPGSCAGC